MAVEVHHRPETGLLDAAFDRPADGVHRRAVGIISMAKANAREDAPIRSFQFLVPTSTVAAVSPM